MENSPVSTFILQKRSPVLAPAKMCGVCLEEMSKYTCPRCNLPYCSLRCFKAQKHAGCSESFYKDCLIEEMKTHNVDDKEKHKIMTMLKNFEESVLQVGDMTEESSLEERLEDIDLDDADEVWKSLNPEEREDFEKSMLSGVLITEWKPWWRFHDASLLKEIATTASHKLDDQPPNTLKVPELPTLLHGKQPSPLVCNNLLDIIYCYAFYCQKYNGNIPEFSSEIARDIIDTSPFLSTSCTANTCDEAIQNAIENCSRLEVGAPERRMLVETVLDVYQILLGRDKDNIGTYVQSALCELHTCCSFLRRSLKKCKGGEVKRKQVIRTMKTLEFMLSWSNHKRLDLLALAVEVLQIYKARSVFLDESEQTKKALEKAASRQDTRKQTSLIQEIK